jgi:hypothetical protein
MVEQRDDVEAALRQCREELAYVRGEYAALKRVRTKSPLHASPAVTAIAVDQRPMRPLWIEIEAAGPDRPVTE